MHLVQNRIQSLALFNFLILYLVYILEDLKKGYFCRKVSQAFCVFHILDTSKIIVASYIPLS
jgi:hypothetical protein